MGFEGAMGAGCVGAGIYAGTLTAPSGPFAILVGAAVGLGCLGVTMIASAEIEDRCKEPCEIPEPTIGSATVPPALPGKTKCPGATPGCRSSRPSGCAACSCGRLAALVLPCPNDTQSMYVFFRESCPAHAVPATVCRWSRQLFVSLVLRNEPPQ